MDVDAASYWAQHAELKAAHHDSAVQVFQSFHKTLQQWHGTDEQRTKLERLIKYVEYCVEVLDDEATCRGHEDLGRVHKYIHSIVLPYLSKLHVEEVSFGRKASSVSYVSMTTTASSTADGTQHPTTSTWADDSASFNSTSSHPDTSDLYWLRLAALKDKYETDVLTVRTALRQHLTDRGRDATSSLHEIEHCAVVLSEDRATHVARPLEELDGVWECIDRVVLPYMSVLNVRTTLTASTDTIDDDKATTPYWREHAMLCATYRHDVLAVEHAYETYVIHMNDPRHEAKKDRVRRLLERVQWVRSVLDEDSETANERSMEELELVYSYVLKYVAPYLNKAAAKEAIAPPST